MNAFSYRATMIHLRQVEGRLVTQGAELSTGELSFKQGESSAGLIYDLALLRIQIHEFKSIAVARVAAQDSSNHEWPTRNGLIQPRPERASTTRLAAHRMHMASSCARGTTTEARFIDIEACALLRPSLNELQPEGDSLDHGVWSDIL